MSEAITYVVTGLLAVVAWFLRDKDAKQQRELDALKEATGKQIALLFEKHDIDANALAELKERIAREHYVKQELDARFDRLQAAFTDGMAEVGRKIDNLTDVMVRHITKGQ